MKKEIQQQINEEVLTMIEKFNQYIEEGHDCSVKRLLTCSAYVKRYEDFDVLVSYQTQVAIIDKKTDTLYDFLRYVYGYTATSAKHISKFSHEYGNGKWGCARELRYYAI